MFGILAKSLFTASRMQLRHDRWTPPSQGYWREDMLLFRDPPGRRR
ncbi:hypothetical protein KUH32_10995 [Thalassococcus sp. CAU 1522]|uniref:Uncharacterized protein n=1 Tax=Thalassococcus arenae TaxID=2851652 RepID=A0ABS6N8G2_9RHOB|nr:hypothetical protein [Thalassococcus arenae]MBV2360304.1 hypothetical protein [Thalassococcus arenae]